MNAPAFRAALVAGIAVVLAACETTGNPREGGLFGWSEKQAMERQQQRRAALADAQQQLAGERRRAGELRSDNAASSRRAEAAEEKLARDQARVRLHEAQVRAHADLLVQESPTPAAASRARRLRSEVEATLANRTASPEARARRLHELDAEIQAARSTLTR